MLRSRLLLDEMNQKNLYKIYAIKKRLHNFCVHSSLEGAAILFFYKILLVVVSQLLLHGIAQNFRWNMRTARDDIDIISVILPH